MGLDEELARLERARGDDQRRDTANTQRDADTARTFEQPIRNTLARAADHLRNGGCPSICLIRGAYGGSFQRHDGSHPYAAAGGEVIGDGWYLSTRPPNQGHGFLVTTTGRIYSAVYDPRKPDVSGSSGSWGAGCNIFIWRPTRYVSEKKRMFSREVVREARFYGNDEDLVPIGAKPGLITLDVKELPVQPRFLGESTGWERSKYDGALTQKQSKLPLHPTFGVDDYSNQFIITTSLMGETESYRDSWAHNLDRWAAEAIQYQKQLNWAQQRLYNLSHKQ